MDKKTFDDFLDSDDAKKGFNRNNIKMPKTKAEVDKVVDEILSMAEKDNVNTSKTDIDGIKKALIRKIELEEDPSFLKAIFAASYAMYASIFPSKNITENISISNFTHVLIMTLIALEQKENIKINSKKLK